MSWLRKAEWPWWQAGLMLGLLNAFAFYTANYYLSTSTTFSRAAGMIVGLVAPAHVAANAYYRMVKPIVDWQFMLLGEGRLINLAAAEGHPASVMDMSFADQALSVEYLVKNYKNLEKKVYKVPDDLDKRVAKLKLESMGIKIDRLTTEQEEYLASWSEGT